ncbi:uncharacterized protein LOC126676335 [Mercurialis annua]|uniref:uncharacterized protein LOC126676335 n=1 Tax=Mercurialis annua TaxID=3986 RepID=UPI00215F2607|nr:uncharacterized protein LOC126676335 [Mercurialis annua]
MEYKISIPNCDCNQPAVLRTSWTETNPGRRFFGCYAYQSVDGCDFFYWLDPPLSHNAKAVKLGLLRKLEKDADAKNKKMKNSSCCCGLKYLMVFVLAFWLGRCSCN